MDHQDWKQVVITKKAPRAAASTASASGPAKKFSAGSNRQSGPLSDFKKIEESDITKLVTSTRDMGLTIQRARMALSEKTGKSVLQTDLDNMCGFPRGTVASYENGTAIVNPLQTQKMSLILGVPIKNPPKPKVVRGDE